MNAALRYQWLIGIAAALSILFSPLPGIVSVNTSSAAEQKSYGEKKGIRTAEEALKALKRHYKQKDMVIGEVAEKELYFEAEIRNRENTVIDKVIIDKRTGRIRSIY